jgi:hypothetical protein
MPSGRASRPLLFFSIPCEIPIRISCRFWTRTKRAKKKQGRCFQTPSSSPQLVRSYAMSSPLPYLCLISVWLRQPARQVRKHANAYENSSIQRGFRPPIIGMREPRVSSCGRRAERQRREEDGFKADTVRTYTAHRQGSRQGRVDDIGGIAHDRPLATSLDWMCGLRISIHSRRM